MTFPENSPKNSAPMLIRDPTKINLNLRNLKNLDYSNPFCSFIFFGSIFVVFLFYQYFLLIEISMYYILVI